MESVYKSNSNTKLRGLGLRDRESNSGWEEAQALLIESGRSLVMFPEATISKIVPELSDFKDGPFRLAIEKQVPILPITFIGNYKLIPDKGVFEIRPGKVIQYVHTPVETKGLELKDVEFLKNKVQTIISNKIK